MPTALVMPLAQRHREAARGRIAGLSALDLREFHEHRVQRRRRTKLRQCGSAASLAGASRCGHQADCQRQRNQVLQGAPTGSPIAGDRP
eukprot:3867266-Alexandrium_andersonii.AAC.1